MLKSEEVEAAWEKFAKDNNIKTTTCPSRGEQSYYSRKCRFVADRFPRSDYYISHDHFEASSKLRRGLAKHTIDDGKNLLDVTIELLEEMALAG